MNPPYGDYYGKKKTFTILDEIGVKLKQSKTAIDERISEVEGEANQAHEDAWHAKGNADDASSNAEAASRAATATEDKAGQVKDDLQSAYDSLVSLVSEAITHYSSLEYAGAKDMSDAHERVALLPDAVVLTLHEVFMFHTQLDQLKKDLIEAEGTLYIGAIVDRADALRDAGAE